MLISSNLAALCFAGKVLMMAGSFRGAPKLNEVTQVTVHKLRAEHSGSL